MALFLINLLLALAWGAVSGSFSAGTLGTGFVFGYLALLVARPAFGNSPYHAGVWRAVSFAGFFVRELVVSSIRVAVDVLTPRHRMEPGIVAVPIRARTDAEITLLANLISLTPGTLSLDLSTDRRTLYVHAMYEADEPDRIRADIRDRLERRVLELFRGTAGLQADAEAERRAVLPRTPNP